MKIFDALRRLLSGGGGASAGNPAAAPDLRERVFAMVPGDVGVSPASHPGEVWGVLMDSGLENGAYSLLVLADGTTSLYFSSGGGIIGAGAQPEIAAVSRKFLAVANEFAPLGEADEAHPLPQAGRSAFHFLTYAGVRSYGASQADLAGGMDPMSRLFLYGHAVITKIRERQEVANSGR